MKVRMNEHYQDSNCHLYPDNEYEVDNALGEWLLKHRKAVMFVEYDPKDGGILIPKESRPDFAKKIAGGIYDVEPQFEQAEEPPQPQEFKNRKSGRRAHQ